MFHILNLMKLAQKKGKRMLDPAPRVILDKEFGLCSIGRNMKEIGIISDIYEHTIQSILRAENLGGFQALPAKQIFDLEYWDLEQAKLLKNANSLEFEGESCINYWCCFWNWKVMRRIFPSIEVLRLSL